MQIFAFFHYIPLGLQHEPSSVLIAPRVLLPPPFDVKYLVRDGAGVCNTFSLLVLHSTGATCALEHVPGSFLGKSKAYAGIGVTGPLPPLS